MEALGPFLQKNFDFLGNIHHNDILQLPLHFLNFLSLIFDEPERENLSQELKNFDENTSSINQKTIKGGR